MYVCTYMYVCLSLYIYMFVCVFLGVRMRLVVVVVGVDRCSICLLLACLCIHVPMLVKCIHRSPWSTSILGPPCTRPATMAILLLPRFFSITMQSAHCTLCLLGTLSCPCCVYCFLLYPPSLLTLLNTFTRLFTFFFLLVSLHAFDLCINEVSSNALILCTSILSISINDPGGPLCEGTTPLHDAITNDHMAIVQLLVRRGALLLQADGKVYIYMNI